MCIFNLPAPKAYGGTVRSGSLVRLLVDTLALGLLQESGAKDCSVGFLEGTSEAFGEATLWGACLLSLLEATQAGSVCFWQKEPKVATC